MLFWCLWVLLCVVGVFFGMVCDGLVIFCDVCVDCVGEMWWDYYDIDDFLVCEYVVMVEFVWGVVMVGLEVIGFKVKKDLNGCVDVLKEYCVFVLLWWLDGEMVKDVYICEMFVVFVDDVFVLLKVEDGVKIINLRMTCELYFGFVRVMLDVFEWDVGDDVEVMELVIELKEKISDVLEWWWWEVLVDLIGRVGDDDKTERLLSREERRIWDAGRMA